MTNGWFKEGKRLNVYSSGLSIGSSVLYFCDGYTFDDLATNVTQITSDSVFTYVVPTGDIGVKLTDDGTTAEVYLPNGALDIPITANSVTIDSIVLGTYAYPFFYYDEFTPFTTQSSGTTNITLTWTDEVLGQI